MQETVLSPIIIKLLENAEFLCIATRDVSGNPFVANKFLIKCGEKEIYFGDFAQGGLWRNLKSNPRISIAVMDTHNLIDYQINGEAQLIQPGADYTELMKIFSEREVRFSTKRLIESIRKEKGKINYQLPLLKRLVIWKIDVKEVVELGPHAELERSKHNKISSKE